MGSHALKELHAAGFDPVTIDNLSQGHREAIIEGDFVQGDLADEALLERLFREYKIEGVMHFASRCYVGESVKDPQLYYQEVVNALMLLRLMLRHGVHRFTLSSTCATYGNPVQVPISEDHPQDPVNPYGEMKYFLERILRQYDRAYGLKFVALRYFNAAGAHLEGLLGESHHPETHLIPRLLQSALGNGGPVEVYGDDYPTADGTCIRDYIHVQDLARAHVLALRWLNETGQSDFFNLGTGQGYSVQQVIEAARQVTGRKIPVAGVSRRPGDPPELVADAAKASRVLSWTPQHSDLSTIIESAWNWEQKRRY